MFPKNKITPLIKVEQMSCDRQAGKIYIKNGFNN